MTYAIMLREGDGSVDLRRDRHIGGLFALQTWLDLLIEVGFDPLAVEDAEGRIVFVGRRPTG